MFEEGSPGWEEEEEAEGHLQRTLFVLTVKAAAGVLWVLIPTVRSLDAEMSSVYWTVSPEPADKNSESLHSQLL